MPLVKMPDGQVVDMPDQLSPEQVAGLQAKADSGGVWDTIKESVKDLARGAMKGAGALAEGAANTGITNSAVELLGLPKPKGMDAAPAQAAVESVLPTPPGDSYRRSALEGLGGALATGPATAVTAAAGVTGGLAGEFGKRVAGGPGQLVGNLIGGIVGGGVTSLATRARPQTAAVAREALEGFSEAEMMAAQSFKNRMDAAHTPVDLAQALMATTGRSGNLTSIRDALANRSQGNKVQELLRTQPENLQREGQMTVAGLPGRPSVPPLQAANNVQETATARIQADKKARTELWEKTVRDGVAALQASEGAKVAQARTFAEQTGISLGEARGKVADLLRQLQKSQGADAASVQGANQKLLDVQDAVKRLQAFSLPRGATETNAGSYSTLPQRGQSIINDSITREVQAAGMQKNLPPVVESAPSLPTLQTQKALTGAQQAEQAAAATHAQAQAGVRTAAQQAQATTRIPPKVLEAADAHLADLSRLYPNSNEAAQISKLRQSLQTPEGPLTDPKQINKVLTDFTDNLASVDIKSSGVNSGTVKYLGGIVSDLRERLGQGFSPIREANDAFKQHTAEVTNPLRQGPVGALAQPHGYDPAVQASMSKFDGLMRAGTEPGAKVSEIRTAIKELAKIDPSAAEDAFKGWVSRTITKSMDTPVAPGAPSTNSDMAKRIYEGLFKDASRWQGIKDATAAMAEARGMKPEDVIRGLENYRQLTLAATSRPLKMEGLSASDISQLGGNSAMANAVRIFSFLPANRVGEAIERSKLGKTFSDFDSILTSPEGAARLIKLGKVPVMSDAAQVMFATLGAGLGNPPALSKSNPPE